VARAKQLKVPITERALTQRINRLLRPEGRTLKTTRGNGRAHAELGAYYVLDLTRHAVVRTDVDLSAYAIELGALQPYEVLTPTE
jgi:hypothetical protein